MKALVFARYGPPEVLHVADLPVPKPGPGELLIRVHAAALNPKDVLVRKGKLKIFSGRRFPQIPGYDLAGEVAAKHPGIADFAVGDPVLGMIQSWKAGACAEFALIRAQEIAPRPRELNAVAGAALPLAGLTALQALRDLLRVGPGTRVLINGASGGVGTYAVQVGRILGAEVTAVCSERNADLVRRLGAAAVIDYTKRDLLGERARFDAFFDVFGNRPYRQAKTLLTRRGAYVTTVPNPESVVQSLCSMVFGGPRLVLVKSNRPDLEVLTQWVQTGRLKSIVDRTYPLEQAIDAHRYLETKRAQGKVVLTLDHGVEGSQ